MCVVPMRIRRVEDRSGIAVCQSKHVILESFELLRDRM